MRGLTAVAVVIAFWLPGCSSSVQQPQDVADVAVVSDTSGDADVVAPDVVGVDVRSDVQTDTFVDVPCDPQCGEKTCGPSACEGVYCGMCDPSSCCSLEGQCTCCPGCDVAAECGDWECGASPCLDYDGVAIPCGTCDVDSVCDDSTHTCCTPHCDGYRCEDDGCGHLCECASGVPCLFAGTDCGYWSCDFPDALPTTWDKSGVVNYMHVPVDIEEQAACFDYTGDDLGDCGISGLALQINPLLEGLIAKPELALIFEFASVNDFVRTADFTLKGLMGTPVPVCDTATPPVCTSTLAGDMYLDQDSYMEDTCLPMIFFEGSSIAEGKLAAGPNNFRISVPLSADLLLTVNLIDTGIKADLTAGDSGVSTNNGVLSGVVTKAEITAIFASLQAECDKDPQPEAVVNICPYLAEARDATATMYDLHQDGDWGYIKADAENPGDAASICLHFTLAAAKIVGYTPR